MLMICGRQGTRPNAGFDLKAVRTGTGAALVTLHSDVLVAMGESAPGGMKRRDH